MQIFPDTIGAASPLAAQAQDAGSPSGSGSSSTNTATVTANDFLQLLIAEMKNQDPTANSDPTKFIDQLVQVNSLQQLVEINQDLGGGTSDVTTPSGDAANRTGIESKRPATAVAGGNLSAGDPGSSAAAAVRVASALGRSTETPGASATGMPAGNPFDAISAAMHGRASAIPTTTTSPAR
ncbi:MAG TPA: flagellar hook capping FlgD N-terminal domain-containing protein [Acidobacteriaceae bacterium]|nr:flagellar hook capping FlgD N-terminal domain-containing protein [Acidobacteriaceae bacterium]